MPCLLMTNLFVSNKNIEEIFQQMNKQLKSVCNWFKANNLSIISIEPNGILFVPLLKSVLCLQIFQSYSLMV